MLEEGEYEIRKSNIEGAGKGVYTLRDIKKNEMLGEYKGKLLTPKQFHKKPHHCDYIWEILDEDDEILLYLDGGNKKFSNWTRFVNCPCTKEQDNVKPVQIGFQMFYFAKRDIVAGEELFVWYGPDYGEKLTGKTEL